MVNGLERFKQYFAPYINQYVLIGGVACSVLMEEAGLDFRATKDLDIIDDFLLAHCLVRKSGNNNFPFLYIEPSIYQLFCLCQDL
jgi:hypothetical protein